MHNAYADGVFFHKATSILGKPDVLAAMTDLYDLLDESFPLEGLLIHHFFPMPKDLSILYLVKKNHIEFIGRVVPLEHGQAMFLRAFSMTGGIYSTPNSLESQVVSRVFNTMSDMLPDKPRGSIVCCLKAAGAPLGLLRVLGPNANCFAEVHERRLGILSIPLGFALLKLLRRPETRTFMRKRGYSYERLYHQEKDAPKKLIGADGGLKEVMDTVDKLSGTDAPVLILGETGTGKEIIADAVQAGSPRNGKPFIKVNCGAIPETLMDSTLFGHEKGAFTGAYSSVPGKFEQANGGTLFLDEVGELPLQAQVRLLRTLQNHVVERVGSTVSIPINVRIIAATNRDLRKMLREGAFREDLYHRLNVFTIQVPPLRERPQDILNLASHFIREATKRLRLPPISGIDPASTKKLLDYPWPGNIRELENLVERAVTLNYEGRLKLGRYLLDRTGPAVEHGPPPQDLEPLVRDLMRKILAEQNGRDRGTTEKPRSMDEAMRKHILAALRQSGGKVHGPGGAGDLLNINPDTLRKRMKKLGIAKSRHT
ncbi:MAG: sigma 54-interacting transcriptional regulator [Deltaproteobacteria bacterium]|nr:sigma 54-interacting transcriptional regulator [Deltaproteobacteria bacterium]